MAGRIYLMYNEIMAKVLFFNPPSKDIYLSTNVGMSTHHYPNLTLATLAGNIINKHIVKVVELDLVSNFYDALFSEIRNIKPDIIATTIITPNYSIVKDIMSRVKEQYPHIQTIIGGVHATALPRDVERENCFDIIAIGEGDIVIPELISSSPKGVNGIIYKDPFSGERKRTQEREHIRDLNAMPYPAWQLFPLKKYKHSRLSSRRNPVGLIETSRGCAFRCNFCNKLTFGSIFRAKSPKRVVDEIEYMLRCGFEEIHIIDDSFTQDINRAKLVCVEIMKRGLKFPWSLFNGIRVDMVDLEFFKLAKKAGLWQVGFGIESGDQNILDRVGKGITLYETEKAVRLAKKSGIDTFGFFILGMSDETKESMRKTIDFAKKLPLDLAKFDICIPYPGTPYYEELKATGKIRSFDWSKYNCHQTDEPLYNHPNLDWPTITTYYKRAFNEFYLRPNYVTRRLLRSIWKGDLIPDASHFLNFKW